MKFKIIKQFNKENGHFLGYSLYSKAFWFLWWQHLRDYSPKQENNMEHDIVWLFSMNDKVKYANEYL